MDGQTTNSPVFQLLTTHFWPWIRICREYESKKRFSAFFCFQLSEIPSWTLNNLKSDLEPPWPILCSHQFNCQYDLIHLKICTTKYKFSFNKDRINVFHSFWRTFNYDCDHNSDRNLWTITYKQWWIESLPVLLTN